MNKEGCDFVYYTKLVIAKHPSIIHLSLSSMYLYLLSSLYPLWLCDKMGCWKLMYYCGERIIIIVL